MLEWPQSLLELPDALRRPRKRGAPVDPDLASDLSRVSALGGCRSEKQLHLVAKNLKIDLHSMSTKMMADSQRQYLIACRRAMQDSCSDALSVDAKRFGGKHFIAGCLQNCDSQVACWMPPQVVALGRGGAASQRCVLCLWTGRNGRNVMSAFVSEHSSNVLRTFVRMFLEHSLPGGVQCS